MKSKPGKVLLSELRDGEFAGRKDQQKTDSTTVYSYLECKRAGSVFPPLKVTKDHVIIAGNHRHAMYHLFYKDENPLIDVVVYDISWDDSDDFAKQVIKDMAFADNWDPGNGKPLDYSGVKANVEQHVMLDKTDAKIMEDLGPTYGALIVRRALNAVRQALLQENLNHARRLVKAGMPPKKAVVAACLPSNTDPDTLTPDGKRGDPKVRTQKITKAGAACGDKWGYQLDQATDFFRAKSITQEALLSVVDAMDRAAATLLRQAQRSRRLTLETIAENAKRLRFASKTVGA
jgi:hypothetical protein